MKRILLIPIVLLLIVVGAYVAMASSVGPNSCATAADDATVGTQAWGSLANACGDDLQRAVVCMNSTSITENSIKIIKGGVISGTDHSTGATLPTSLAYVSYGSSSDLWGLSWTPADMNGSTFGLAFSVQDPSPRVSHYLTGTNYSFSIPTGATINGIVAEVKQEKASFCPDVQPARVDNIRITVYYTTSSGVNQVQIRSGNMQVKSGTLIIK